MDFEFTEEQNEFRRQIARFVDERVVPQAERYDQSGEFPREIMLEFGELGYLGIKYPESLRWLRTGPAPCVSYDIL